MPPDKTEGSSHVLTFAGIEFYCLELETSLLKEKFDKNLKGQFPLFYPDKEYNQRSSNRL